MIQRYVNSNASGPLNMTNFQSCIRQSYSSANQFPNRPGSSVSVNSPTSLETEMANNVSTKSTYRSTASPTPLAPPRRHRQYHSCFLLIAAPFTGELIAEILTKLELAARLDRDYLLIPGLLHLRDPSLNQHKATSETGLSVAPAAIGPARQSVGSRDLGEPPPRTSLVFNSNNPSGRYRRAGSGSRDGAANPRSSEPIASPSRSPELLRSIIPASNLDSGRSSCQGVISFGFPMDPLTASKRYEVGSLSEMSDVYDSSLAETDETGFETGNFGDDVFRQVNI
ncbi:unnamed protein product [Protopolystoma xenopodis]|uniref:Uncharacterized protein n=1 Tax=Protopolystoma xenopodis TaxID=117903 RepID=A0A3S5A3D3_9PLAT|nr:unnamed protein product [Protopolystoma xenopodis]